MLFAVVFGVALWVMGPLVAMPLMMGGAVFQITHFDDVLDGACHLRPSDAFVAKALLPVCWQTGMTYSCSVSISESMEKNLGDQPSLNPRHMAEQVQPCLRAVELFEQIPPAELAALTRCSHSRPSLRGR